MSMNDNSLDDDQYDQEAPSELQMQIAREIARERKQKFLIAVLVAIAATAFAIWGMPVAVAFMQG